jgi:hypothetical protein
LADPVVGILHRADLLAGANRRAAQQVAVGEFEVLVRLEPAIALVASKAARLA